MGGVGSGRKKDPDVQVKKSYEMIQSGRKELYMPNLSGVQHEIKSGTHGITTDDLTEGSANKYWDYNADTNKIINVVDPTANQDAATKKYVDDENMWETVDGETQMKTAAFLDMRDMRIVNCQNPVGQQDVVTKNYGDSIYIYSPPFTGGVARSIQYASDPRSSVFEGEAAFLYDPSTNTQTCDKITSNSGVDFNITSPTGTVTLGDGTAGVDYILKFDGETNDGIITWKEDEDRFECSDEFRVNDDFHVTGESFQPHAQTQPSRSLNTTYQNTTGHPIIVYGSCKCTARNDNVSYTAYFQCKTDGSSPPTTVRQTGGYNLRALVVASSNWDSVHHTFNFVVANNDYYRIDTTTVGGDASVILDDWNEVDF